MQKMEAVGQLTGGIAHDFNNMLSIVISSLNLLQRRLDRGDTDVQRFAVSAMEGANRAASLTSRLLASPAAGHQTSSPPTGCCHVQEMLQCTTSQRDQNPDAAGCLTAEDLRRRHAN